jgi:hypothetical protein
MQWSPWSPWKPCTFFPKRALIASMKPETANIRIDRIGRRPLALGQGPSRHFPYALRDNKSWELPQDEGVRRRREGRAIQSNRSQSQVIEGENLHFRLSVRTTSPCVHQGRPMAIHSPLRQERREGRRIQSNRSQSQLIEGENFHFQLSVMIISSRVHQGSPMAPHSPLRQERREGRAIQSNRNQSQVIEGEDLHFQLLVRPTSSCVHQGSPMATHSPLRQERREGRPIQSNRSQSQPIEGGKLPKHSFVIRHSSFRILPHRTTK